MCKYFYLSSLLCAKCKSPVPDFLDAAGVIFINKFVERCRSIKS